MYSPAAAARLAALAVAHPVVRELGSGKVRPVRVRHADGAEDESAADEAAVGTSAQVPVAVEYRQVDGDRRRHALDADAVTRPADAELLLGCRGVSASKLSSSSAQKRAPGSAYFSAVPMLFHAARIRVDRLAQVVA